MVVVGEDGSGMGNGDGEGLLSIHPGARTSAAVGRKIGGDKFGERARERKGAEDEDVHHCLTPYDATSEEPW